MLKLGHFLWADVSDFMSEKVSSHMPPKVNEFSHRPNSGNRATWHVTGLLSNRTISYLQVWHRNSCSALESQITVTVGSWCCTVTDRHIAGKWGRGRTEFVETRHMKRDSTWDQSVRRSGRWLRTKCCGSAALTPNVINFSEVRHSLFQPNLFLGNQSLLSP